MVTQKHSVTSEANMQIQMNPFETLSKMDIITEKHPNESESRNTQYIFDIFTMRTLMSTTDLLALPCSVLLEMNLQDSLVLAPHLLYFPLPSCSGKSVQEEVEALGLRKQSGSH